MNYLQILEKCKHGFTGIIPGWKGYLDWDWSTDEIYFHNKNYILNKEGLEEKLDTRRNDFYYII